MTAVSSSVFTAAQFNTFVRDNLNETAPAKATTAGAHFAVSGTYEIAERISASGAVLTSETTTSTTYDDLATEGPAVSVETGAFAVVIVHGSMANTTTGSARMSYEISGATSDAPADNRGVGVFGSANVNITASGVALHTNLTPGTNTFTAKYRVSTGTGTFQSRRILVMPF